MSTALPEKTSLSDSLGKIAYLMDKAYLRALHTQYSVMPFKQYTDSMIDRGELDGNSADDCFREIAEYVRNNSETALPCKLSFIFSVE